MQISHIASGSSGNAILIDDGESKLLLDAGISYKKIARHIRPSSLAGVLITHEHGDHSKAVTELLRRGCKVYFSIGTFRALNKKRKENGRYESIMPFNPKVGAMLKHLKQVDIGSWTVLPFNVIHDAEEPMGFLFQSKITGDKGVYIADSAYVQYNFSGVSHWIIEANYADEILETSDDEEWLKDRIRQSHFSFDDLCRFFDDSDLSETEEIHLVHLSDRNSHEEQFKRKLQSRYGVPVYTISDSERERAYP